MAGMKELMLQVEQKSLSKIEQRIQEGNLVLPNNYKFENAITSAMLIIKQDPKLLACDPVSIGESINKMAVLGLDPAQTQCYFVPMGNKCTLMTSYFGKQAILKRIPGVIDIVAQCIYEGDTFDYQIVNGQITTPEHKTSFLNRNNEILGAYSIILLDKEKFGRSEHVEVMTFDEIKKAWDMGNAKGNSKAHTNFKQEMSKRSVINRGAKNLVNTLHEFEMEEILSIYKETTENEYKYEQNKEKINADYVEKTPEKLDFNIDAISDEELEEKMNTVEVEELSFDFNTDN